MPERRIGYVMLASALAVCLGCRGSHPSVPTETISAATKASDVGSAQIINADQEPGSWLTHGRTYSEQRFSPLKQINDQNAPQLGLAWSYDLDTNREIGRA